MVSEFILIQIALSTLLGLVASMIWGQMSLPISVVCLVASTGISFFLIKPRFEFIKIFLRAGYLIKASYIILGYLFLYQFQYLFFSDGNSYVTLHKNNFGDLPLHIQFIKFLSHAHFWPENPILSSHPMSYPFGMDFYNSLFEAVGINLQTHLFLVGSILSLVLLRQLYKLGSHFLVYSIVFGGGIAFFDFFKTYQIVDFGQSQSWKNLIHSVWITQRGFLFALPAGLVLLRYLFCTINKREQQLTQAGVQSFGNNQDTRLSKAQFWTFVMLWGAMPFFHVHSFLILSFIILSYLFVNKKIRVNSKVLVYALAIAIPIFIQLLSVQNSSSSFLHWKWGWDKSVDESFFIFWIRNWGLYFVFLILIGFYVIKTKSDKLFDYLYMLGLFLLFNGLQLAPWSWDNIKVLIWIFILLCILINEIVIKKISLIHFKNRALLLGIYILCGATGVISHALTYVGYNKTAIYNIQELSSAESVLKQVPVAASILTAPVHNSEMSYFGRAIEIGYAGHMWSLGLNDKIKTSSLRAVMSGDCSALDLLDFEYLFWGPKERALWGEIPDCLKTQIQLVQSTNLSLIYKRIR